MNNKRILFAFIFIFYFVAFSKVAIAQNSQTSPKIFTDLQSRYLKIRNTDTDVKLESKWRQLATDFINLASSNKITTQKGQSLYNAAIIYEQLYVKLKEDSDLKEAIATLESIPRDLPGDLFADDALLKLGDIHSEFTKDLTAAKRFYTEIIYAYKDSEMVPLARSKIQKLSDHDKKKESSETQRDNTALPLVIIDPGHGGEDFGAVGKGGLQEKDVVLDVALKLQAVVREEGIYNVRLTRTSDRFVPLKDRTNFANDFEARLFISLHVNSNPSNKVSGIETYYLDNTDDKSSLRLAERENQFFNESNDLGDLNFILSDLIQNAKLSDSITLANVMQRNLIDGMKTEWGKQINLGVKKAPFYVLVGVHIPCALIELYFINNPADESKLARSEFRSSLANSLNQGIKEYLLRDQE